LRLLMWVAQCPSSEFFGMLKRFPNEPRRLALGATMVLERHLSLNQRTSTFAVRCLKVHC